MTIDPKLIEFSKCGKYVYPRDSITGMKTFALVDYFKKLVETKYNGSVERFVKEYKTRETKKYLDAGYTPEQVKELASKCKNFKLPKIVSSNKKDPRIPKKERKVRLHKTVETNKTVVTNEDGTQQTITIYPWSNNPEYFKSSPAPLNMGEATKDTCFRPDIYLDDKCYGCNFYNVCTYTEKYTV